MALKLEVGKSYRTRNGQHKVTITRHRGDLDFCFEGTNQENDWIDTYDDQGRSHHDKSEWSYDLVAEWKKETETNTETEAHTIEEPETVRRNGEYPIKTLRDEFAMAALIGMLSCPDDTNDSFPAEIGPTPHYTKMAYKYADAMIKAREKNNG